MEYVQVYSTLKKSVLALAYRRKRISVKAHIVLLPQLRHFTNLANIYR